MRDDHLAKPFAVLTTLAFAPWFSRLTAWRVEIAERRAADVGRELRELEDSLGLCPDLVVHKAPNPGRPNVLSTKASRNAREIGHRRKKSPVAPYEPGLGTTVAAGRPPPCGAPHGGGSGLKTST
jgi:hypothetical protein